MANDQAWQAGMDIAQERKDKKSWGNFGQKPQKKESGWKKVLHVLSPVSNFDHGGPVKRTGLYKLKKGEHVLTAKQARMHGIKGRGKKKNGKKRVACKG
jgi:hypothetical protein